MSDPADAELVALGVGDHLEPVVRILAAPEPGAAQLEAPLDPRLGIVHEDVEVQTVLPPLCSGTGWIVSLGSVGDGGVEMAPRVGAVGLPDPVAEQRGPEVGDALHVVGVDAEPHQVDGVAISHRPHCSPDRASDELTASLDAMVCGGSRIGRRSGGQGPPMKHPLEARSRRARPPGEPVGCSTALDAMTTRPRAAIVVAVAVLVGLGDRRRRTGFDADLQVAFGTVCSGITVTMVFVIQHTQRRSQQATQLKLDELIRSLPQADDRVVRVEASSDAEIDELEQRVAEHHRAQRVEEPTATP